MTLLDKWNKKRFSVYDSEEKSTLELMEKLSSFIKEEVVKEVDNKVPQGGNFTGKWQGLDKPTLSEEGMRSVVEQLNNTYIYVNPSQDLFEVMENADKPLYLLEGVYIIDKPIKFKQPIEGVSLNNVTIKAKSGFLYDYMIDFNDSLERKYIKDITLDMNNQNCSAFGSSLDGSGSSSCKFENIWFINGGDNFVINAHSEGAVSGMLTGSVFNNCYFNGNKQLLNIGQNQDDITFIGCRFAMDGFISENLIYRLIGTNIKFDNCYFFLNKNFFEIGGIKPLFEIGSNTIKFQNVFFESSQNINCTHIFYCSYPTCNLSFDTIHFNLQASSLIALIRYGITSSSNNYGYVEFNNLTGKPNFPNTSLVDLFNGITTNDKKLKLKFSNVDVCNTLVNQASGGYDIADVLELEGIFKNDNKSNTFYKRIITGETLNTTTITIPITEGVWLINIKSKIYDDINHSIIGTYLVNYMNKTYKIASCNLLGETVKSDTTYTIGGLQVGLFSNGNLQITTTYTGTFPLGIEIKGTKINSF